MILETLTPTPCTLYVLRLFVLAVWQGHQAGVNMDYSRRLEVWVQNQVYISITFENDIHSQKEPKSLVRRKSSHISSGPMTILRCRMCVAQASPSLQQDVIICKPRGWSGLHSGKQNQLNWQVGMFVALNLHSTCSRVLSQQLHIKASSSRPFVFSSLPEQGGLPASESTNKGYPLQHVEF